MQAPVKKRAVFIDRDATIIAPIGFRCALTPEEVVLLPRVADGMNRLKKCGLLLILVTNQGRIETGELTENTFHEINRHMEKLIAADGGPKLDGIYFCPHKRDIRRGRTCECGKPAPGMLLQAAKDFDIDLKKSYIIGDDGRDMEAGKAAGLRGCMMVSDGRSISEYADLLLHSFYKAAKTVSLMEAYSG